MVHYIKDNYSSDLLVEFQCPKCARTVKTTRSMQSLRGGTCSDKCKKALARSESVWNKLHNILVMRVW